MIHLNDPFKNNDTLCHIRRFMVVGMIGTLVDIALFTGLHVGLGVPVLLANTLSYSTGGVNNFVLHRRWTYGHREHKAIAIEFSQFAAVSLSALMLNNLLLLLLTPTFTTLLPHAIYGDLYAKVCATAVVMGWNFVANNFWTFRKLAKGTSR